MRATDTHDLTDERAALQEQVRLQRDQERADYAFIMASASGRRVMRQLLDEAGQNRSSFLGGPEGTFFREGERNVALRLNLRLRQHCPNEYLQMIREGVFT